MVSRKKGEVYKDMPQGEEELKEEGIAEAKEMMALKNEIAGEAKEVVEKFKDPQVLASLYYRTYEERKKSNRVLATILQRLDRLEEKIGTSETVGRKEEILLPSVDEEIIAFIKQRGHICAEDVKRAFSYKGKNAASARLNRLYEMGLLKKEQVGRMVYFKIG